MADLGKNGRCSMAQTQTAHTPGPWEVGNENPMSGDINVLDEQSPFEVALVRGSGNGQARANARLIAAAPDLLAACEAAIRTCHGEPANDAARHAKSDALYQAAAAIAKAS